MNTLYLDIAKHLTELYNKNNSDNKVNEGEVLNKFQNLISSDELYRRNKPVLDKLFSKCISDEESLKFANTLFSKVNEGFYNPFDGAEEDDDISATADDIISVEPVNNQIIIRDKDENPIHGIRRWDSNVNGKVYCKDGKMYSGRRFIPGDVLEECPVVEINNEGLFSRTVRDMAFQLYPDKEVYGIPMGYANCYDNGVNGNVDYEYDPEEGILRIIAISNIKPNNLLVLRTTSDFIK